MNTNKYLVFLISKCRRVLNVVFFLLGDSPASEFTCRRFGTLCLFHKKFRRRGNHPKRKNTNVWCFTRLPKGKKIQTWTEFQVFAWKLTRTRGLQRVVIIFSNTKRTETFRWSRNQQEQRLHSHKNPATSRCILSND